MQFHAPAHRAQACAVRIRPPLQHVQRRFSGAAHGDQRMAESAGEAHQNRVRSRVVGSVGDEIQKGTSHRAGRASEKRVRRMRVKEDPFAAATEQKVACAADIIEKGNDGAGLKGELVRAA